MTATKDERSGVDARLWRIRISQVGQLTELRKTIEGGGCSVRG